MEKTTECKRCGKSISKYILSIQNKPDSTEWVRNGFCSHSCFAEFAESNPKPSIADVITKPKATKKKRTKNQKVKLLAFLIEGPPSGDNFLSDFGGGVVISASQTDWKKKIRRETGYPEAEVKIVQPQEWDPPGLGLLSHKQLSIKYPAILDSITKYITHNDIEIEPGNMENHEKGTILNTVSGKAFFLFKY